MEQPELFLGDVEEFIHHIWPVAGVTRGSEVIVPNNLGKTI
jgi:hypothetical protein